MTKKDYLNAVSVIGELKRSDNCTERETHLLGVAFAVFFSGDNPRFDSKRFREALAKETGHNFGVTK